jgi:hypothetical protein
MRRRARRAIAICAVVSLALLAGEDFAHAQTLQVAARAKKAAPKSPAAAKSTKKTKKGEPADPAKEARMWSVGREGANPLLRYGRGSDETIVSFACQPDAGLVRVVAIAGPRDRSLRVGDGARIRLMSGRARFELAGTAFSSGPALYVSGTTRIVPRFFQLFRASETMTVEVPGRTTGISLKALGARATEFERACLAGDK